MRRNGFDNSSSGQRKLVKPSGAGGSHETKVQRQLGAKRQQSLEDQQPKGSISQQQPSLKPTGLGNGNPSLGDSRSPNPGERKVSGVQRKIEEQRKGIARRVRFRERDHQKGARRYSHSNHCLRDPVDSILGEVILDRQDFTLPGRIPLHWKRHYGSQSQYQGVCGRSWESPGDVRLVFEEVGKVLFQDGSGAPSIFDALPATGTPVVEPVDGRRLLEEGGYYLVWCKEGLAYSFPVPKEPVEQIRLERIADRLGNSVQYFWDANGLREIRESSGRRIEVISRQGRIESMSLAYPGQPAQLLVRYNYDEQGNLTTVYDALDIPYRFVYRDNLMIQHTNRNGVSFYYEYDQYAPEGRCIYTHGDGGLYEGWFVYHDDQKRVEAIGALGTTTFLYDQRYLVLEETNPLGEVARFEYDEHGRTIAVIDPEGNRTEYAYDNSGNTTKLIRTDGKVIATEYDTLGNPVRVIDPNGAEWKREWNDRAQLSREISPLGTVAQYRYDDQGQLSEYLDPQGNTTKYTFDAYGNLCILTNSQGQLTQYTYDPLGNVTSQNEPLKQSTSYRYDRKGRLVETQLPDEITLTFEYDGEDNLLTYNENGVVTRMEYCGVNKVKRKIQPNGQTVEYEYNKEEEVIAVINQKGERYELVRDGAGRIVEEVDYWGQSRKYRYTVSGYLQESIDPLGRSIQYRTDALGRVIQKVLPPAYGTTNSQVETFQYDSNGNLIACANGETRIKRRFDLEGKLVEEEQGNDIRVVYGYDPNGNRLSRTIIMGTGATRWARTVKYSYDNMDQATDIEVDNHPALHLIRNAAGQLIHETLGSQVKRFSKYDDSEYLVRQLVSADTGLLFELEYDYDQAGNLKQKRDSAFGTDEFLHNPMRYVIHHSDPTQKIKKFLYDPAGNRLATRTAETSTNEGRTDWGRCGELEDQSFRFDRAGNLVERKGDGAEIQLVWDAKQQLSQSVKDGQVTYYRYDPLGRRISKETSGVTTRFVWDGDAMAGDFRLETKADRWVNARMREWVYLPGGFEPLVLVEAGAQEQVYYYSNDPNGCPARLISESGQIVWAARYDVWGKVSQLSVNEVDQPLRFQGQHYDEESGLHYSRFRYYDPEIGSFVSQDPLGLAAGENVYRYAPNPFGYIDPLGLFNDGGPGAKFLGHADFSGSDRFDFTKEDHGPTHPFLQPERHFRSLRVSEKEVRAAIESGNREEFQRAMHRGQDYFCHYNKGYRWKPLRVRKSLGLGHAFSGTKPDKDVAAWKEAEEWTKKWLSEWDKKHSSEELKRSC